MADARLGPLKDLNGYFPFAPPESRPSWQARSEQLRRQVLVSQGLWPMPTRTPAKAVIHGRREMPGYSIEKVYFQSFPGHFVTGNLYRPLGRSGKLPAVLSPHGHWSDGRFHDAGAEEVRKQIEAGAEHFAEGGRSPLQARCVQLARLGCVVFHYDMVGYADSKQLGHRPGVRAAMNTAENWGYFSPQAELRMQHMMGLQTYNSLRALDFLAELPDVDPRRIGVTGASGGGTQTFVLCAIDPRPAVSFPAVMVSTAMQGGCTCENACYLRIGTGNVELAGLFAPRPLGLTGADDWTREIMTKGFPELQSLYELLGARDHVTAQAFLQFGHNYNAVSRGVMYAWMNEHLGLGAPQPIVEEDYPRLTAAELTVWDAEHPAPPGGDGYERSLLRWITEDSENQLSQITPTDAASLEQYRALVGGAWEVLLGQPRGRRPATTLREGATRDMGGGTILSLTIQCAENGARIPAWLIVPEPEPIEAGGAAADPDATLGEKIGADIEAALARIRGGIVWIDPQGKQGLLAGGEGFKPSVARALKAGYWVLSPDLLQQGEHGDASSAVNRQVDVSPRELEGYAGYTYGYNHPLFAQRVHDVLAAIEAARAVSGDIPGPIHLAALNGAGHWGLAAAALCGPEIDRVAVDARGFRFAELESLTHADFLPGAVKYFDLPGLMALTAPHRLWIGGERELFPGALMVHSAYEAAGAGEAITQSFDDEDAEQAAVAWLIE